jgi:hypothetical protein
MAAKTCRAEGLAEAEGTKSTKMDFKRFCVNPESRLAAHWFNRSRSLFFAPFRGYSFSGAR